MQYTDLLKDDASRGAERPGKEQLQTLEQLIAEGLYIDRTMQIKNLYCSGVSRCDYLMRPRGFGKRIFCDTLEALFTHDFERLKGAAACDSWTEPYCRVVRLDFARIARAVPERSVLVHESFSQSLHDKAVNEGYAASQLSAHANDDFRPVSDDPDNLQPPFMYSGEDAQADGLMDSSADTGSDADSSSPMSAERRILNSSVPGGGSADAENNPDGSEAGEDGDDLYIFGSSLYSLLYEQITREDRGPSGAIMADHLPGGSAGSTSQGDMENFGAMLSRCTERASFVNINQLLTRCRQNSRVLIIENFDAPLMAALDEPRLYNYRTRFIGAFLNLLGRNRKIFRHILVTGTAAMDYREATEEYPPLMKYLPLSRSFCYGKESSGLLGVTEEDLRSEQFRPFIDRAVTAMNNEFIAAGSPPPFDYESMIRRLKYYYGNYSFDHICTVLNPVSVINFLRKPENGFRLYWFEHSTINFSALCKACRLTDEQLFVQLERIFKGGIRLLIEGCIMPVLINDEGLNTVPADDNDDEVADDMHRKIQALLSAHPDVDMDRLLAIMQRVLKPATFRRFVKEFFPERYKNFASDDDAESMEESTRDMALSIGESLANVTFADDGAFVKDQPVSAASTATVSDEPSMMLDDNRDQESGLANDYESTAQLRRANDNEALAQGGRGIPLPAMLFFMGYLTSARYHIKDTYTCMPSFEVYHGFKTLIVNHFFNGNGNITRVDPLADDTFFPYDHKGMLQLFHEVVSSFDASVLREELTPGTLAAALMLWMQMHHEKSGTMATGTGYPLMRDEMLRRARLNGLEDLDSDIDLDKFTALATKETAKILAARNAALTNNDLFIDPLADYDLDEQGSAQQSQKHEPADHDDAASTPVHHAAPSDSSGVAVCAQKDQHLPGNASEQDDDTTADSSASAGASASSDVSPSDAAQGNAAAPRSRPDIKDIRRLLAARAAKRRAGAGSEDQEAVVAVIEESAADDIGGEYGYDGEHSGEKAGSSRNRPGRSASSGSSGRSRTGATSTRAAGSGYGDYGDDKSPDELTDDIDFEIDEMVRDAALSSGMDVIDRTGDNGVSDISDPDGADAQGSDPEDQSERSRRISKLRERIRQKLRGRSEHERSELEKSANEEKTLEQLLEEGMKSADAFMNAVDAQMGAESGGAQVIRIPRDPAETGSAMVDDENSDKVLSSAESAELDSSQSAQRAGGSKGNEVNITPADSSLKIGSAQNLVSSDDTEENEQNDQDCCKIDDFGNLAVKFIKKPSARTIMNLQKLSESDARSLWKHSLTRKLTESQNLLAEGPAARPAGLTIPAADNEGHAVRVESIVSMINRSRDVKDPSVIIDYRSYVNILNQLKLVIVAPDCREKRDELARLSQLAYEKGLTNAVKVADEAIARIDAKGNEVKGGPGWADYNDLTSVLIDQIQYISRTRSTHEARSIISSIMAMSSEQRLINVTAFGVYTMQQLMKGQNSDMSARLNAALGKVQEGVTSRAGERARKAAGKGITSARGRPVRSVSSAQEDAAGLQYGAASDNVSGSRAGSQSVSPDGTATRESTALRKLFKSALSVPDSVGKAITMRRIMLLAHENGDSELELEILEAVTDLIKRMESSHPGLMKKKLDESAPAPFFMSIRPIERQFGEHERMLSSLNLFALMADPYNSGINVNEHNNLTIYDNHSAIVLEIGVASSSGQLPQVVTETRKKLARVRNPLAAVLRQPRTFAASYITSRVSMVVKNDFGDCSLVELCNIDDGDPKGQYLNYEEMMAGENRGSQAALEQPGHDVSLEADPVADAADAAAAEAVANAAANAALSGDDAAALPGNDAAAPAKPRARRKATTRAKAAEATASAAVDEPEAKEKPARKTAVSKARAAAAAEAAAEDKPEAKDKAKPARKTAVSKARAATAADAAAEDKPEAKAKAKPARKTAASKSKAAQATAAAAEDKPEAKAKAKPARKAAPKAAAKARAESGTAREKTTARRSKKD